MKQIKWIPLALLAVCGLTQEALACGCFAPPLPTPGEADFAVNQQAEQIIFEVQDNTISAHVRIFYQGEPEQFAWLLPMPTVPELELSNGLLFGIVDAQTGPSLAVSTSNICPQQKYVCRAHSPCPDNLTLYGTPGGVYDAAPSAAGGTGSISVDESENAAPPVVVLAEQTIGAYETVTFAAEDASLAIDWLNENGFIINETMSPYMQPYLDEGMVFVASKLVPGADVDEIRPLRLTYESDRPSIPLQLTAIAAEPHMMVTALIYSDEEFDPSFHPQVEIPADELSNGSGRSNYPMVLSRVIDEEGGDAFVKEYVGSGPVFQDTSGCCSQGDDWCGIGNDNLCQCPETDFDAQDCSEQEELVEAVKMARSLSDAYPVLTRLSTRVSPEEMVYNPEFTPSEQPLGPMRLALRGADFRLTGCEDQVIDTEAYDTIIEDLDCSAIYCDWGECAHTARGAGCACDEGFVARTFTDVDGQPSITCVPEEGTVDFAAGGIEVPDSCAGQSVTDGQCVDVGGFPAVQCESGKAAVAGPVIAGVPTLPSCEEVTRTTGTKGATNYTAPLEDLEVCAPPPPACRADGWLEEREVTIPGVSCGEAPDPSWFVVPPAPVCDTSTPASGSGGTAGLEEPASTSGDSTPVVDTTPTDTTSPRPEPAGNGASANPDGGISEAGEGPSENEDAGAESVDSDGTTDNDSGWCSVAQTGKGSTPSFAWLLALGLLFGRRRRS